MKKIYIISICTIICAITLSWCYHKKIIQDNDTKIQINDSEISWDNFTWYLELKSENDILTWSTSSLTIISWFFYPIIISWGNINYSWSVSLILPNIFKYRDYYRNPQIVSTRDWLIFSSDEQKTLMIETTLVSTWDNIETICKWKNNEWRLSKQENKTTINGQEIKITKQTFMTSWEWAKPQKWEQTSICFVRNNVAYNIRWSDININEDTILNSISFY